MGKGKRKNDNLIVFDVASRWFGAVLLVICFVVLLAIRLHVNHGLTGDEPHYLIENYSLVHDKDLSLANNYRNQDNKSFDVTKLEPQGVANVRPQYAEKEYSSHGKGLTYLMTPGFYIAGKTGAVFTLVLLAVSVVYLTWRRTKQVTNNIKLAYLAAATLTICYFFNALVGSIYPDMLISAVLLVTLILLDDKYDKYYKQPRYQLLLGLVLGFLIIVHFKALIIVIPALAVITYKLWRRDKQIPWLTFLVVGAFTGYYFLTLYQWFGDWNLSRIQDGQPFNSSPFRNIPAMLFDSNRSLFVYNPVTLLVVVGLPIWYKLNRKSLIETLLVVGPTAATLAIIPNWNGSASPTGRYIVELLPALMPSIAFAFMAFTMVWQRVIAGALMILTFLISFDATYNKFPYINGSLYTTKPVLFTQIKAHTGLALDKFLPVYSNRTTLVGRHDLLKVLFWSALTVGLFVYGIYLSKHVTRDSSTNKTKAKYAT